MPLRSVTAGLLVATTLASGCTWGGEEWLLVAQGNRLNPTKFAVSTGRTFSSKMSCVDELYRINALPRDEQAAGLMQDEHLDIRLDYFCMRIR